MLFTLSWPSKSGVASFRFVNGGGIKVGKPSLDVPCRNQNRDFLALLRHGNLTLLALFGKLLHAASLSQSVAVNHDNQRFRNPIPVLSIGQ